MTPEIVELRIRAEKIGTVREVMQLLADFENAYNSIYVFIFFMEKLSIDKQRKLAPWEDKYFHWSRYLIERAMRQDYPYDLFTQELARHIDNIVPANERLTISKINIQSPGFWEFLGNINPLQQIRDFIKDLTYRNKQEKELGKLEILKKKIEILRDLGYREEEMRQFVITMIDKPLNELVKYLHNRQIEGVE